VLQLRRRPTSARDAISGFPVSLGSAEALRPIRCGVCVVRGIGAARRI